MNSVEKTNNTSDTKNFYILKGRFKSNSMNFYGLFLLIFNSRNELDIAQLIVSTFSSTYDLEPYLGWEKFEEFIVNAKWKGSYNPNMTGSIEDYFKRITPDQSDQIERLIEYIRKYDYDNIDSVMFDIINRIIHDKNLILETNVQETSEKEFRETKENRTQKKSSSTESKKSHVDEGVTLQIQLILAPVSGKPIYELKIGDIIMTKIIANTDRANYFIDLLDLRVENLVKPVPSKVIDIKSESRNSPIEILTEIGPGVFGKCIEDERQVKLRMYDPLVDGQISKKNKQNAKSTASKEFSIIDKLARKKSNLYRMLYIIFGSVLLVALFVIILYLIFL